MIRMQNLHLRRGTQLLLEKVDCLIHSGHKVGLTGANGAGKSSLFALIRGEIHTDTGSITLPQNWVTAHVAQEIPATEQLAIDYVLAGDAELIAVERALLAAQADNDGQLQSQLYEQLESIDGYTARTRASVLLHGLGFEAEQEQQPVNTFSGGWRMRLNLAKALMCRSDLLLLDEPTNHLDLEAVYWLEDWLRQYRGTLLLISHDRDFLDAVVGHILHIEQQRIKIYSGNYSDFELARAEHLAHQQAAYQKQQRQIAHMRQFVVRFKAKASKAKQAQSRVKALEKMAQIAPAHVDSPFQFQFRPAKQLSAPLLTLDKAAVGYSSTPLVDKIDLSLSPGDRIGLIGPNGAGKSTVIKLIAGLLTPLRGKRKQAKDNTIGYFAQHQLEQLDDNASPIQHLQRLDQEAYLNELRDYIGGFGFNGDRALTSVKSFSGGEKARLVLALLVYLRPTVLLLDEPTNHLDLEMRLSLTIALQNFEGALVIVSHDRHLLNTVVDQFWLVADGQVGVFDGDIEQYRQWVIERDKQKKQSEAPLAAITESKTNNKKQTRQQAAMQRQQLQPLRKAVQTAEKKINDNQNKLAKITEELADNALYNSANKSKLTELLKQQATIKQLLEQAEAAWLDASEALELASEN